MSCKNVYQNYGTSYVPNNAIVTFKLYMLSYQTNSYIIYIIMAFTLKPTVLTVRNILKAYFIINFLDRRKIYIIYYY